MAFILDCYLYLQIQQECEEAAGSDQVVVLRQSHFQIPYCSLSGLYLPAFRQVHPRLDENTNTDSVV